MICDRLLAILLMCWLPPGGQLGSAALASALVAGPQAMRHAVASRPAEPSGARHLVLHPAELLLCPPAGRRIQADRLLLDWPTLQRYCTSITCRLASYYY